MPYANQQQLVERFGLDELIQITNRTDPTATTVNSTRVDDASADIDALVDAKLQARYALPLATIPRLLVNIACDMMRARLYDDRVPDAIATRDRDAKKLLDDISAGRITLGLDAAQQPTPTTDGPQVTGGHRVFSAQTLADY